MDIEIITNIENTKSGLPIKKGKLDIDKFKSNLKYFSEKISSAFPDKPIGNMSLDEIVFTIEVSAEGGISLIGSSKVAASSAIQVKFKRIGK